MKLKCLALIGVILTFGLSGHCQNTSVKLDDLINQALEKKSNAPSNPASLVTNNAPQVKATAPTNAPVKPVGLPPGAQNPPAGQAKNLAPPPVTASSAAPPAHLAQPAPKPEAQVVEHTPSAASNASNRPAENALEKAADLMEAAGPKNENKDPAKLKQFVPFTTDTQIRIFGIYEPKETGYPVQIVGKEDDSKPKYLVLENVPLKSVMRLLTREAGINYIEPAETQIKDLFEGENSRSR